MTVASAHGASTPFRFVRVNRSPSPVESFLNQCKDSHEVSLWKQFQHLRGRPSDMGKFSMSGRSSDYKLKTYTSLETMNLKTKQVFLSLVCTGFFRRHSSAPSMKWQTFRKVPARARSSSATLAPRTFPSTQKHKGPA